MKPAQNWLHILEIIRESALEKSRREREIGDSVGRRHRMIRFLFLDKTTWQLGVVGHARIPAFGRLDQEDHCESEADLHYIHNEF